MAAGATQGDPDGLAGESLPDALDQGPLAQGVALDAKDRELVASQPGRDVLLAHGGAEGPGAAAQEVVARGVPLGVVDGLQIVEIEREDGGRMAKAPAALFFGGEELVPPAPVVE